MIALSDALMSVPTDPEGSESMLQSFPLHSLTQGTIQLLSLLPAYIIGIALFLCCHLVCVCVCHP